MFGQRPEALRRSAESPVSKTSRLQSGLSKHLVQPLPGQLRRFQRVAGGDLAEALAEGLHGDGPIVPDVRQGTEEGTVRDDARLAREAADAVDLVQHVDAGGGV